MPRGYQFPSSRAPLSQRAVREEVFAGAARDRIIIAGVSAFIRLNFWGRLRWLLFGVAAFKPPKEPQP